MPHRDVANSLDWIRETGRCHRVTGPPPLPSLPALSQCSPPRNHSHHKLFQWGTTRAENRKVIHIGHNSSMCMTEAFVCVCALHVCVCVREEDQFNYLFQSQKRVLKHG